MDTHIDWLSFTMKDLIEVKSLNDLYEHTKTRAKELCNGYEKIVFNGMGFEACGSRPPYRFAMAREDQGCRSYGGSHTSTVLVELTGRGCAPLAEGQVRRALFAGVHHGATRVDIATDIRTGTNPADFCNKRTHQAFRSVSYIRSDTGETVYVGSPKSDRFCRVYRYNPPHPRSEHLRVEFVFRRALARDVAARLADAKDLSEIVAQLGNTWGFTHREWRPSVLTDEKIKVPQISKGDDDTVRWLYSQVAPAIRRLLVAGALDITDFLQHVYNTGGENSHQ